MKRKNGSHGAMDGKLFAASNGMGASRAIEVAGHDDRVSMAVLLVLYTLQGIPMGLCSSLPVILKERGISFEDLALLSLASLPFSLKLLWAPIVDCKFFKSMGRRKSWLIPVQLLCGGVFIFGSKFVTEWIETQNIKALTGFFIFLYFLMATQDIAVDGWALTMLSPEHVGYASLCNSIGQSFGFFLANQGFIALNDPTWCFRHLGTRMGRSLIDLSGFMHFWGWVFIVVTLGIWFGKEEKDVEPGHEPDGLMETYQHVLSIFKLHPVQTLTIILLTCRVAFAPVDSAWNFKLMESGVPKADIATISPLLLLIGLILPAMLSKLVSSNPIRVFLIGYPLKLLTSLLGWLSLSYSRKVFSSTSAPSYWFYAPLTLLMMAHEVASQLIFVSSMSFFARVSDPSIGGTYMTLLNTIQNLGMKWPTTLSLYFLPRMTFASCTTSSGKEISNIDCKHGAKLCEEIGGACLMKMDGFTVQVLVCTVLGLIWLVYYSGYLTKLGGVPSSDWLIVKKSRASDVDDNEKQF